MPIVWENPLERHVRLRIVSLGKIRYSRSARRIRVLRGGSRHFRCRRGAAPARVVVLRRVSAGTALKQLEEVPLDLGPAWSTPAKGHGWPVPRSR